MSDEIKNKKSVRGNIPGREADLIGVSESVLCTWRKREMYLLWTSPDEFEGTLNIFSRSFDARNKTKGDRRVITHNYRGLNLEINRSVKHVKGYLADKFPEGEAPSHYAQFGIVKHRKEYVIPADGDRRLHALGLMVKAIEEQGFSDRNYGKEYWTDIFNRFSQAKSDAVGSDRNTAEQVSVKSDRKAVIIKTLNALIYAIKANYPDSWKEELRAWGFQKEKY
jgi:hypothetical protein